MDTLNQLKVMLLCSEARLPSYANEFDAGLDLYSVMDCQLNSGEFKAISTGIAIELPPFHEAQIRPRSGLALNKGITVLNSPGTIDQGYRGEIKVILINHSKTTHKICKGDKIAQMVIAKVTQLCPVIAPTLSPSKRNQNGFGSSGK